MSINSRSGPTPAKSNLERQRMFRKRNPGYYARLQAARRASAARGAAITLAMIYKRLESGELDQPSVPPAQEMFTAPGGC